MKTVCRRSGRPTRRRRGRGLVELLVLMRTFLSYSSRLFVAEVNPFKLIIKVYRARIAQAAAGLDVALTLPYFRAAVEKLAFAIMRIAGTLRAYALLPVARCIFNLHSIASLGFSVPAKVHGYLRPGKLVLVPHRA